MHTKQKRFQDLVDQLNVLKTNNSKQIQQVNKYELSTWHLKQVYQPSTNIEELKSRHSDCQERIKRLKEKLEQTAKNEKSSFEKQMSSLNEIEEYYTDKITNAVNKYEDQFLTKRISFFTKSAETMEQKVNVVNNKYKKVCCSLTKERQTLMKRVQLLEGVEKRYIRDEIPHRIKLAKYTKGCILSDIKKESKIAKSLED